MDMNEPSTKDKIENIRKSFIILSMFVVGILLLLYKVDPDSWTVDGYTQMVVGIATVLSIVGLLLLFMDMKRFFRHELFGFVIGIVAAFVLLIYPAAPVLDIEIGSTILIVGMILAIISGVFLARLGGYFAPCIIGLGCQIAFAGYYTMWNPDASIIEERAFTASNIGVGFLILSFILMIYQDLKFYYLTNLIKNANRLRKEKKYEEALRICDKALTIYPYFVTALNNKGNILFNLKKPKEAIEYYTKAIDINPAYKQAQNNLEVVQRKMGRALGQ
jgi:hypothetical protein